jgi:hypothetical protein
MIPARSFDGLLLVAGLMDAEMAGTLGKARKIFDAAGSDLEHVVRVLQFHSDLGDFPDSYREWRGATGDAGPPFSAIEVGRDLFVPGASHIVDLWGSVPA